jgi:hypothetical protein
MEGSNEDDADHDAREEGHHGRGGRASRRTTFIRVCHSLTDSSEP